jgi:DNA excision repair protein ERCC-3
MTYRPDAPLIAQSDHTILLEAQHPRHDEARDALHAFAELVKSPDYIHTWRITDLTLWNASSSGHSADEVVATLQALAKYPVPEALIASIRSKMGRFGRLRLERDGEWLLLVADDARDLDEVVNLKVASDLLGSRAPGGYRISPKKRGELKQVLLAAGRPVQDLAGYDDGDAFEIRLSPTLKDGRPWAMRDYQLAAADAFHGGPAGGSGVVVLPCGAGKTVVGITAMARLGMRTLILCTGHTALQQWKREILDRTSLREEDVGEYSAERREIRPVTLTTYQLLTWRPSDDAPPPHFRLFYEANWGLVIYDEVHLLPAPIFRESAYLQARRRLGLTATLVREDGREGDVFALIGPKRFDLPWKQLEQQGWIAEARCVEVRVALSDSDRERYVSAPAKAKFDLASKNARKGAVLDALLQRHADEPVLVLGSVVDQLGFLSRKLGFPVVTGETPIDERDALYDRFRRGEIRVLGLSKVGNFSVDLPSASVAVQVSGTWGSRQEEAQRLGRVLRRKDERNTAVFYTVVTSDSREQELAEHRQLFLAEQGYPYRIEVFGS